MSPFIAKTRHHHPRAHAVKVKLNHLGMPSPLAENKVVLNTMWLLVSSWLVHSSPRRELGADGSPGSEVLPMCETLFF